MFYLQRNLQDHIKHTEVVCNHLRLLEKVQKEIDSKVRGLDEITSKMSDQIDHNRFLDIIQVNG